MDSQKKFKGEGPDSKVRPKTKSASNMSYEDLKAAHIKDFHSLFNRVNIDLGQSSSQQKSKSTDKRKLDAVNHFDPDLEELLFQFGRYLLISSSRSSLPANLQVL
jgi:alpha-L-fucosidase 2